MWNSDDHLKISTDHQLNGYGKWPKKREKKLKTNMCRSWRKMALRPSRLEAAPKGV
jgi:hypothetical protein